MADEQTSSTPKRAPKTKAAEASAYEQATEQGYIGSVAEEPPNEAYQVDADHEATAETQRQALRQQRDDAVDSSRGD